MARDGTAATSIPKDRGWEVGGRPVGDSLLEENAAKHDMDLI